MNKALRQLDMPHLVKRMKKVDETRLQKLRTAKENKDIRHIAEAWAAEKLRPKVLTEQQRMAIHLLTDMVHNYSMHYISKRIGITDSMLGTWRNDPFFISALDKEITRRKSFMRLHAFRNVNRAIARGDMKATWNYLKMSGDLKENINVTDDRTGERELSDDELKVEIDRLQRQMLNGSVSSVN